MVKLGANAALRCFQERLPDWYLNSDARQAVQDAKGTQKPDYNYNDDHAI